MDIKSCYLPCVFDPERFHSSVRLTVDILAEFEKHTPFDTIAFTGVSGAALAFPLSYLLGKPLLCVRKANSSTHSSYKVEGNYSAFRYIIVDDFISSGKTMEDIQKNIERELAPPIPELVGIYLYRNEYIGDHLQWVSIHDKKIPVLSPHHRKPTCPI